MSQIDSMQTVWLRRQIEKFQRQKSSNTRAYWNHVSYYEWNAILEYERMRFSQMVGSELQKRLKRMTKIEKLIGFLSEAIMLAPTRAECNNLARLILVRLLALTYPNKIFNEIKQQVGRVMIEDQREFCGYVFDTIFDYKQQYPDKDIASFFAGGKGPGEPKRFRATIPKEVKKDTKENVLERKATQMKEQPKLSKPATRPLRKIMIPGA